MTAELRRHRDTLATSGIAIIAFGAWDVVKAFATTVYGTTAPQDSAAQEELARLESIDSRIVVIGIVLLGVVFLSGLALRVYVGLSAWAEARGKRKGWGYVVAAGLMAATNALLLLIGLSQATDVMSLSDAIASGLIDLTSLLALVDLVHSALVVKRLDRQQIRQV